VRNPVYGEQITQEEAALAEIGIQCQPLGALIAIGDAMTTRVRHAAFAAPVSAGKATDLPAATAAAQKIAMQKGEGQPTCGGGMARQIASGTQDYVCLCPGNTIRVSVGDNAYVCEKRFSRR
jgi:hypothetical protein